MSRCASSYGRASGLTWSPAERSQRLPSGTAVEGAQDVGAGAVGECLAHSSPACPADGDPPTKTDGTGSPGISIIASECTSDPPSEDRANRAQPLGESPVGGGPCSSSNMTMLEVPL